MVLNKRHTVKTFYLMGTILMFDDDGHVRGHLNSCFKLFAI